MKLTWFGRRDVALRVTLRVDPTYQSDLGAEVAPPIGHRCQTCTMPIGGQDTGFLLAASSGGVHAECVDDELLGLLESDRGAEVSHDPGRQLMMAGRLVTLALASQERERKVLAAAMELWRLTEEVRGECGEMISFVKGKPEADARLEACVQKLWKLVDEYQHFSEIAVARNGEVFGKPAEAEARPPAPSRTRQPHFRKALLDWVGANSQGVSVKTIIESLVMAAMVADDTLDEAFFWSEIDTLYRSRSSKKPGKPGASKEPGDS